MTRLARCTILGIAAFCPILLLAGFCWPDEMKSPGPRFSLKLTGGARYVVVGDLNEYLNSFNSLLSVAGEITKVDNWSSDLELEVRLELSSKIGLGLATSGFFNKRNQSSLFMFAGEAWVPEVEKFDTQYVFIPEIKSAMPLGLNFYYSVYQGPRVNLLMSLGAGWYTGTMTGNQVAYSLYSDGAIYFGARYWSVEDKFSLGFQGGLGLEYGITPDLVLVAELQGRFARMGSLEGTVRAVSNYSLNEVTGTLYYYQWAWFGTGPWYRELMVHERPPEGAFFSVKDVREARLDLGGFALRIGLRVRLF